MNVYTLEAGRELDALIASIVFNLHVRPNSAMSTRWEDSDSGNAIELPHYSTDMAAAWQVVNKLQTNGYAFALWHSPSLGGFMAAFRCGTQPPELYPCDYVTHYGQDETAPLAICRAALVAYKVKGEKK